MILKKVLLVLFFIFSIFSSLDIRIPSNISHAHTHINNMGIEHIHVHSHIEVPNTLFIENTHFKETLSLKKLEVENTHNLNSKHITNLIFRPPIL